MRRPKRTAAFVLALLLSASTVSAAFGAEKPEDMDDITWARLQDNKLEYDEIEHMIRCFSPAYLQVEAQFNLNIEPMETAIQDLKQEIRDYREEAKYAKEDGDMMGYMIATATAEAVEKEALRSMESGLKVAKGTERTTTEPIVRQLTSAVQQLMNGYNQAQASLELMNTAVELAEAAYNSTVVQRSLGMATDTAVESAEKSLLSARNQQQSLINTLTTLRQNLCILIGLPYDAMPEIGAIPVPQQSEIDAMNPEQDITRAISYNATIKSQRKPGKGDVSYYYRDRTLEETEAKLKIKLESLYEDVLKNQTACWAAETAFQSASLVMDGNQLKYQMGMMGRLEYLQAKMGYLQAKMTYDMAILSLKQSMEDYYWAVRGIVELD